jgi:flagellar biosynthesis protein FliQ
MAWTISLRRAARGRGCSAWRRCPQVSFSSALRSCPTPRFLLHHGQTEAARRVLFRLRGGDEVEHELAEIESVVRKPTGGWSALLAPGTRMALVVGVGLAIFQQITGINTVLYYTPTIIQLAGVPSASGAILAAAGIGAVNVMLTCGHAVAGSHRPPSSAHRRHGGYGCRADSAWAHVGVCWTDGRPRRRLGRVADVVRWCLRNQSWTHLLADDR